MLIFKALKRDIEFRKKCMITLGILIFIRIFCSIPTLGVNAEYFKTILQENTSLGFLNTLTGNGLSSLSVMALSITPYITASIMRQLLGICFPKIHEMQYSSMKDDRDKIEKATIILGFFLAFTEAIAMSAVFGKQGLLIKYTWYWVLIVALIWTAGASIASVLGKYITDNYIGNGISLILAMNIFSSYLSDSKSIYITLIEGKSDTGKILFGLGIFLFFLLLFALTVLLQESEKDISVIYSQKTGNGKNLTHDDVIPLKLCPGSVVPVIFTSTIMTMPVLFVTLTNKHENEFLKYLDTSYWFTSTTPKYTAGALIYVGLVFFFTFYYTDITMNPVEIADNLRKSAGIIPGIRPGKETTEFLKKERKYILAIGAFCLAFIALLPFVINGILGTSSSSLSFLGTSIIITVGVVHETMTILNSMTMNEKYIEKSEKEGLFRA